ncbi:hypothetical protein Ahy_A03g011102 isoform A [Arachis hypogaea]|uniref:Uncharacterized protein n=1 Tax=Arachis hypogaea TaxID=3818 RepID=A0A445DPL5_ARAHY|nr:hypothetical protein Ahy_A03g011102 isoform A [Arachis hypogaea]
MSGTLRSGLRAIKATLAPSQLAFFESILHPPSLSLSVYPLSSFLSLPFSGSRSLKGSTR